MATMSMLDLEAAAEREHHFPEATQELAGWMAGSRVVVKSLTLGVRRTWVQIQTLVLFP